MYSSLVRPIFFSMDPERAHDLMRFGAQFANNKPAISALRAVCRVEDPRLNVSVAGLSFENPIGLAAGLDKNVELLGLCAGMGFGHLELGTVTAQPQPGNPKPRIFRFAEDRALINRMGFPSEGADEIELRLTHARRTLAPLPPLGINIGKSKMVELDQAIDDYRYSFEKLAPHAEYVTVNVSSPNTQGLRQLQERGRLHELLSTLSGVNILKKPIFVKVAPDLEFSALDEVVEVCGETGIAGIIATNTTLTRKGLSVATSEAGGLSGAPLRERSLEVVRYLGRALGGRMALIGVGGISTAQDALSMIGAGASMVQIYTAMIYEGPGIVRALNTGLLSFMDKGGYRTLREAGEACIERRKVA
jgi:dihydroorotate dehydrogenase